MLFFFKTSARKCGIQNSVHTKQFEMEGFVKKRAIQRIVETWARKVQYPVRYTCMEY